LAKVSITRLPQFYYNSQMGLNELFRTFQFEPNNNQAACAAVAVEMCFKNKVLLEVGPGLGKSRMIGAMMYMVGVRNRHKQEEAKKPRKKRASRTPQIARFKVVFSDSKLLLDEQPKLEQLKSQFPFFEIELVSVDSNRIDACRADDDQLLIIDEADFALLDEKAPFDAKYCVGLTATAVLAEEVQCRDYLLKTLGFQYVDSCIESPLKDFSDPLRHLTPIASVEAFLETNPDAAKLIYIDEASYLEENALKTRAVTKDCDDLEKLRSLTVEDVMVATEDRLMRGYDYRSKAP